MESVVVAWTKKRFDSRVIWMCRNERPIFFAKHTHVKGVGSCWAISTDSKVYDASSPCFAGRLICKGIGSGYLLEVPGEETPVFGLKFCKVPQYIKLVRFFRVVFPKNQPYRPIGKKQQLCSLAKTGNVDPALFTMYSSKIPVMQPGGRLTMAFGVGLEILCSIKNFIVVDEQGETVFVVYKSSPGTCSVKFREPLSSIQAFAIAIPCIAPMG
jgi:hypothetical protein